MVATYTDLKNAARQVSEELAESINYGHAIIIVDVAVNAAGEKVFMLAEGNTPATEAAVIENPDTSMGVWFKFDEMGTFVKGSSGIKWSSGWIYSFGG